MRVFLTGGTGYLGGHLARALLERGHAVTALVRDRKRAVALVGCGCEIVEGNVTAAGPWRSALQACDGLMHAAGLVQAWGPEPVEFDLVNVRAVLDLLDEAREAGIERRVTVGSLFAFPPAREGKQITEADLGRPMEEIHQANDYARSKAEAARTILERQGGGDETIMVFPTVLLGPGSLTAGNHTAGVLSDIGRRRFAGLVGSGDQVWNLVPVELAARGAVMALERGEPGENYILGGENWTQRDFVERAARQWGVRPPLRRLGTRIPTVVARILEGLATVTRRAPFLTRGEVRLYNCHWNFSSERARDHLGYIPGGVEDCLAETVTWIREELWKRS